MDANVTGTRRIVVDVDASEHAARAVDWAAELAEQLGAELVVAHALGVPGTAPRTPEPAYSSAQRHHVGSMLIAQTTARVAARHPSLQLTELSEFDPAQTLNGLAADTDVLVTGTVLGSVSDELEALASCPVIVIGTRPPTATRAELVLGVGQKEDRRPLDFAFAMAAGLGLSVRAIRAFEPWVAYGVDYERMVPGVTREVEDLLESARDEHPGVPVSIEPRRHVPVPALIEAGRGARLIVVGSHRRHEPLRFGPGHIVHGLLSHAETPVAVVPIP